MDSLGNSHLNLRVKGAAEVIWLPLMVDREHDHQITNEYTM